MVCHCDKNTYLHRGVRWYAYRLWSFLAIRCSLCGSAICTFWVIDRVEDLHSISYNVPYGQTQGYSVNFLWFETCDHIVVGYSQSFLTLYVKNDFMLAKKYSLVHKPRNLPWNSEYKFAWNKSRPFCEHVITNLSTVRWEFGLLKSMQ